MLAGDGYLAELKKRGRDSRVYRKHQLFGLEIARMLGDERHKSLYIKLAKERGGEELLALAKSIAGKKTIQNKGAYFMACLTKEKSKKDGSLPLQKSDVVTMKRRGLRNKIDK